MALKNTAAVLKIMEKRVRGLQELVTCKSADDVFDLLKASKVKGKPGENSECPIAVFLEKSGFSEVDVGGLGEVTISGLDEDFVLPPAVKIFIKRFDTLPENVEGDEEKEKAKKAAAKGDYARYAELIAKD
jgi:hypothetical protein